MRQIRCTREVVVINTEDTPPAGPNVAIEPTPDLLDRALVGWERFLGTFEAVPDE
ncbi:hypothetical protein [Streptomyces sp. NBC_01546]|uniref:hypothetical protein n=1 Tax=Streptomyces sp. NBC_01546 TaxID=2975872 RepID=UPI00386A481A